MGSKAAAVIAVSKNTPPGAQPCWLTFPGVPRIEEVARRATAAFKTRGLADFGDMQLMLGAILSNEQHIEQSVRMYMIGSRAEGYVEELKTLSDELWKVLFKIVFPMFGEN